MPEGMGEEGLGPAAFFRGYPQDHSTQTELRACLLLPKGFTPIPALSLIPLMLFP